MIHGETIDPAPAGAFDPARDYEAAFQRGRELAVRRPQTSAPHAIGLGVHLARMEEGARGNVARRAEALTEVLRGLRGATSDPAERLRMARHLAGVTPGLGLRPEDIAPHDVTDAGVAGHLASVAALRQAVAAAAQPRYVAPLHKGKINTEQGGVRYVGPAA